MEFSCRGGVIYKFTLQFTKKIEACRGVEVLFAPPPMHTYALEGPEGYLCPGIHILGVICMYHKPNYTSV